MADGYSRTTGQVGLCTITCGPGLTQVGTSLSIAVRNRSPMILITGQIAAGAKNNIQSMDQRRFVEACGARFHDISSADNLADEMAEAFYAARVHRIPVVLNLDMALQEQAWVRNAQLRNQRFCSSPRSSAPWSAPHCKQRIYFLAKNTT